MRMRRMARSDHARLRLLGMILKRVSKVAASFAESIDSVRSQTKEHMEMIDHHDRKKGNRFEDEVGELARSRGFDVRPRTDSKHDLVINGLRTQIKRKDTDRISLNTTPIIGRNYGGYLEDDWDVLVLRNKGITFVIPVEALLIGDGNLVRNHIVPSQYSCWIERWDVFGDGFCFVRESQRSLFEKQPMEPANGTHP